MPTLGNRGAVNNRCQKGSARGASRINTKLTQARLRVREALGLRVKTTTGLTRQLRELVDIEGKVVAVGINNVERTDSNDFTLTQLAGGCRHLCAEATDFTLLTDLTKQFKPDSLNFCDAW